MSSRLVLVLAVLLGAAAIASGLEFGVRTGASDARERQRMMREYGEYNLHLAFAQSSGRSLPDVKVKILGPEDEVVYEGAAGGPMLFARLPRGEYQVTAEHAGMAQTQAIAVGGAGGQTLHYFYWDAPARGAWTASASAGR